MVFQEIKYAFFFHFSFTQISVNHFMIVAFSEF